MAEEQDDTTISLSLVDGISCGLAAALLLFIIFGINISVAKLSVGGGAGHGTIVTRTHSGLKNEPVDIVVSVKGPTSWATFRASGPREHVVKNVEEETTSFVRELADGFTQSDGVHADSQQITINLEWSGSTAPKGEVHVFRSGRDDTFDFTCVGVLLKYALIRSFDLIRGHPSGACTFKER